MKNRLWIWVAMGVFVLCALLVTACVGCGLLLARTSRGKVTSVGYGSAVGVIYIEGVLTSQSDNLAPYSVGAANANTIISYIKRAETDPSVKAILLYINSPGGSVVAADEIYHHLTQVEKPVVAWMGEMAASGGYYVACAADRIVAHPDTLTGSIGVITQIPNVEGLMKKLGVKMIVIKSGAHKDIGSMFREMTDEEKAMWQTIIAEIYDHFVQVVAGGRNLDVEKVRELADGRVYTGRQALKLGLVDELGNFDDAVRVAADLGGISGEPRLIRYQRKPSLLDLLSLGSRRGSADTVDLLRLLDIKQVPSLQYLYIGP